MKVAVVVCRLFQIYYFAYRISITFQNTVGQGCTKIYVFQRSPNDQMQGHKRLHTYTFSYMDDFSKKFLICPSMFVIEKYDAFLLTYNYIGSRDLSFGGTTCSTFLLHVVFKLKQSYVRAETLLKIRIFNTYEGSD